MKKKIKRNFKRSNVTIQVQEGDMNEPRLHPNERDSEDMTIWLRKT